MTAGYAAVEQSLLPAGAARLSRREWLRGFGGLCAILSLPPSWNERSSLPHGKASLEDWILRIDTDAPADLIMLGHVGKTYLTAHPLEAASGRLRRLLVPDGWTGDAFAGVRENVRRDWMSHNVIVVEGWVLARTEARLCGLIFQLGTVPA